MTDEQLKVVEPDPLHSDSTSGGSYYDCIKHYKDTWGLNNQFGTGGSFFLFEVIEEVTCKKIFSFFETRENC